MNFIANILLVFYVVSILLVLNKVRPFKKYNVFKKTLLFVSSLMFLVIIVMTVFVYLWNSGTSHREEQRFLASYNCLLLDETKTPIPNARVHILQDTVVFEADNNGFINLFELRNEIIVIEADNYISDTLLLGSERIDSLYLRFVVKLPTSIQEK